MNEDLHSFFQRGRLIEEGRKLRETFCTADPFPHIVLDGFLPEGLLTEIATLVDSDDFPQWDRVHHAQSKKRACSDETRMPPLVVSFLHRLNSAPFLLFLEALTGIENLICDPHLQGGGLHRIERDGFLKIHADFNVNQRFQFYRRLNLLIYLNRDWEESYGGCLELWDTEMQHCVRKILPIFNRCVVFATTHDAYHGHPDPLLCPPGRARDSIALYYYTVASPSEGLEKPHRTLYRARPGERLGVPLTRAVNAVGQGLHWITPPIVSEIWRRIRSPR